VAETTGGLWVVDDQGGNFRNVYSGQHLKQSAAPDNGGVVAFIQSETEWGEGKLELGMVYLNSGNTEIVAALTNDQTTFYPGDDMDIGDPGREAAMAMGFDTLAWSPDNRYLAFVGAQHDRYADLYSFDLQSTEIRRLVGAESHVYQPVWSPDSQYLLAPSATSFGTGAGFAMDSMWIARPDGSESGVLFNASNSIDMQVWGWLDDETMLFSPVDIMAGYKYLQLFNIRSGAVTEIIGSSDYFYDADFSSAARTVMFSFPFDDILEWVEGETITERGLYLWREDTGAVEKINPDVDYGSWVVFEPHSQCYYAWISQPVGGSSGYMQAYSPYGQIDGSCPALPLGVTEAPTFSASGNYYFWKRQSWDNPQSDSLMAGNLATEEWYTVQIGTVNFAAWHPTEELVFFAQGSRLYMAAAPDFVPVEIGTTGGLEITDLYWAMP
jgi:WD40 repeat protein